jgi:hypothetical protein
LPFNQVREFRLPSANSRTWFGLPVTISADAPGTAETRFQRFRPADAGV